MYYRTVIYLFLLICSTDSFAQNSCKIKSCTAPLTIKRENKHILKSTDAAKGFELFQTDTIITNKESTVISLAKGLVRLSGNKNISVREMLLPPYFSPEISYWSVLTDFLGDVVKNENSEPRKYRQNVQGELGAWIAVRGKGNEPEKRFTKLKDSLEAANCQDSIIIYLSEGAFWEKNRNRDESKHYYQKALNYSERHNNRIWEVKEIYDQFLVRADFKKI